jgi:N,N'-diacetyl-8-epilegionaminate cytidylyltransferase
LNTIAFIFARGGSKGVPRKNIREIAGKPLIAHTITLALESQQIDKVIVSTDDPEIADAARACGAEVPFFRPAELATDEAPEWLAWQHACSHELAVAASKDFDTFVSLPATSPCRSLQDVERAITLLDDTCDVVITGSLTNHHPAFNMVTTSEDRQSEVQLLQSGKHITRRQDAGRIYNIATVAYVSRPEFILSAKNLWDGRVKLSEVSALNAIDIDTSDDFYLAELVLNDRKS